MVKFASEITPIIIEARALDSTVHESQEVIQAALAGAGDRRISLAGKTGNLELLTRSINQLIDGVSTTVAETVQAVQRAVAGDLTSRINRRQIGSFQDAGRIGEFDDSGHDGSGHAV